MGQRWGSILDGEGVLDALHVLFQVLNLPLLLGPEEVFYALKPAFISERNAVTSS